MKNYCLVLLLGLFTTTIFAQPKPPKEKIMTEIYQISTPSPSSILKKELETIFPNKKVSQYPNEDGFESCIMFNLTNFDLNCIREKITEVLIYFFTEGNKQKINNGNR